MFQILAYLS